MNDTVTYRPPVRRVIRGLLADYGRQWGVSDDLLVCMVAAEADVTAETVRNTVFELEADGEIYNAAGDADTPAWKVTAL